MKIIKRFFWMILFIIVCFGGPVIIITSGINDYLSFIEYLLFKLGKEEKIDRFLTEKDANYFVFKELNKEGTEMKIEYYFLPEGKVWLKKLILIIRTSSTDPLPTGQFSENNKQIYVQFFKNQNHFNYFRTAMDFMPGTEEGKKVVPFMIDFYNNHPGYNYARIFEKNL